MVGTRSSAPSSEFQDDDLTDRAAALTYYGVLALFPALIALVSIVGLFGDPETVTDTHHRHHRRPRARLGQRHAVGDRSRT